MLDLTIAIPVKNEAQNLPACLEAIGKDFAQKVVIIDSGSTDGSRAIAAAFGATWINFAWNGKFPKKRNWFLRNYPPQTKWVLFLDADEHLTPAFKQELRRKLPESQLLGYRLNYRIYFEGQPLRGGYPLHKLALFRPGAGEYETIEEDRWSQYDMEIHEHPVIDGPLGRIHAKIEHRDDRGKAHLVSKHQEYARWEAARYLDFKNQPEKKHSWTWRQKLKYALMGTPFLAPFYFTGSFLFLGGFLDGRRGWVYNKIKAGYFYQIYLYLKTQTTFEHHPPH